MDDEQLHLKNKTMMLLQRERELLLLRASYERAVSGLKLAQSLPELVDHTLPLSELCMKLGRALTLGLRVQRTSFFEHTASGLLPLATKGDLSLRRLPDASRSSLVDTPSGLCNDPAGAAAEGLAAAVGLHRFVWATIRRAEDSPILLVAGFDAERAAFQRPFDETLVAQAASVGHHLESLLANALLLKALEREKDLLEQRVVDRTVELENALARLKEKEARIDEDLRQARKFQRSILPVTSGWADVDVAASYQPLDLVGGDIYDAAEIAPGKYRVFVADATGHGVQASLRTIVLKAEYDRLKREHRSPDGLLEALNDQLAITHPSGELLSTACCVDIDLTDRHQPRLRCASAAHPPVLVFSAGTARPVVCDGSFLGLPGATFPMVELPLEPGAVVLLYSDGVSDQMGPGHSEFDLPGALRAAGGDDMPLRDLLDRLVLSLHAFRAEVPVTDDLTLVAARIRGEGSLA